MTFVAIGALGVKLFCRLTHLIMKFILPINVIMPTIVGIITFISRIKTSACFNAGFQFLRAVQVLKKGFINSRLKLIIVFYEDSMYSSFKDA